MGPPMRSFTILAAATVAASAAIPSDIYNESDVPPYTVPDPLVCEDGSVVTTAADWTGKRRAEVFSLIEREMFGKAPPRPAVVSKVDEDWTPALDGKLKRKQIAISLNGKVDGPAMDMLLYVPADAKGPVPVVFGLNFQGNQGVSKDPGVRLCRSWLREKQRTGIVNNKATDDSRGCEEWRWQIRLAADRGYGVATICYCDIDPDFDDGWKNGVHALFPEVEAGRDGATWGSVAAWAWGMSLGMDYLEKEPAVDAKRVVAQGHSTLGKTALWAGASDHRFALVIANESGAGGAALNRRIYGETVGRLTGAFPHWFCGNFKKYSEKEENMAFDSHEIIALIAPRPVLITSSTEHRWDDAKGEFEGGLYAEPVYKLFGKEGLGTKKRPGSDKLTGDNIGYFLRSGGHDVTRASWMAYLDFADRHLR